jgi:uncharacterized membrane protein YedE/YeeE
MKRLHLAVSFVSGLLFAAGLALSGMTQPSKVLGFLDFTGSWNPSLLFVMAGAIGVHIAFAQRALRAMRSGGRPALADSFQVPTSTRIDARLIGGAALFGMGWGLAGICPGPALVSVARLTPSGVGFVAAMAAGILIASRLDASDSKKATKGEIRLTAA